MNLSDVIQQYLADRLARGAAKGTQRNTKAVLEQFLADIGNVQTRNLRPQHVDLFWSRRTTWSPGTMNRGRATLNTFFIWCQNRGHIARDMELLAGQKAFKVPPRDRLIIPQSEFSTVLETLKDPRDRAITALGLYLFLRISEISSLRWQDLNFDDDWVEVYRSKTYTRDSLPLCEELVSELRRWKLAYASKAGQTIQRHWFVIPALSRPKGIAVKGQRGWVGVEESQYLPTTKARLNRAVTNVLQEIGYYAPHEGGHTFRRSGATALYHQLASVGHDRAIRLCQAMLGHANLSTTEIYLRLDLDRKVRNDLLAGKPMFPSHSDAELVNFRQENGVKNGQANAGNL